MPRDELRALATSIREITEEGANPAQVGVTVELALSALVELVPCRLAAVCDRVDDSLVLRAIAGRGTVDRFRGLRFALGQLEPLRRALHSGRPLAIEPSVVDPHSLYGQLFERDRGGHVLLVPTLGAKGPGVLLLLDRRDESPFAPHEVDLAVVYGKIAWSVLAMASQRRRIEELEAQLEEQNRYFADEVETETRRGLVLEESRNPAMQRLLAEARQVATTDAPVLIMGETGTGKEVMAHAIHRWSHRASGPFVKLNCAVLPSELIESELFGHVKGAFSGAHRARPGRFRIADRGTLLLDEIGQLAGPLQPKLLRVLQEGAFQPVGSDKTVRVDVRIVAATNVDLLQAVEQGRFREDLFYRLNVFPLRILPLRERVEDLPLLVNAILDRIHRRTRQGPWIVTEAGMKRLRAYDWPGNVRELVNVLERARIVSPGRDLSIDIQRRRTHRRSRKSAEFPTLEQHDRDYLRRVLRHTGGRIYGSGGAAELLGLKPTTLQSRLKKLGIDRSDP